MRRCIREDLGSSLLAPVSPSRSNTRMLGLVSLRIFLSRVGSTGTLTPLTDLSLLGEWAGKYLWPFLSLTKNVWVQSPHRTCVPRPLSSRGRCTKSLPAEMQKVFKTEVVSCSISGALRVWCVGPQKPGNEFSCHFHFKLKPCESS